MQKRKFRINILDFLIVALVILCVAGAVMRMYTKSNDVKLETQKATISFLIQDVQSASQYAFADGDRVYSPELECELGYIEGEVVATPAVYYNEDGGVFVKTESAGSRVDIRGKFVCEGTWTDASGFAANGTQYIAPNMSVFVSFPGIKTSMLITDVEVH